MAKKITSTTPSERLSAESSEAAATPESAVAPEPTPEAGLQVAARYVKPGEFFAGAPARDLTVSDFEALTPGMRELCVTSGLYVVTEAGAAFLPTSPVLESVKPGEPFNPRAFVLDEAPVESHATVPAERDTGEGAPPSGRSLIAAKEN